MDQLNLRRLHNSARGPQKPRPVPLRIWDPRTLCEDKDRRIVVTVATDEHVFISTEYTGQFARTFHTFLVVLNFLDKIVVTIISLTICNSIAPYMSLLSIIDYISDNYCHQITFFWVEWAAQWLVPLVYQLFLSQNICRNKEYYFCKPTDYLTGTPAPCQTFIVKFCQKWKIV